MINQFKYNIFAFAMLIAYGALAYVEGGQIDQSEIDTIGTIVTLIVGGQMTIDGVKVVGSKVLRKGSDVGDEIATRFEKGELPS